jgi:hypothetical protein
VRRRGPLPVAETVSIGIDVCRALGAVHGAGLLHRDIKAQNILRDGTGRIVLGDFGTGVAFDDEARVGAPQIAGTPLYMAPEVFRHQAATVASDVYGVGVLLYFLLTGNYPVRGQTFAEIRQAHADGTRSSMTIARHDCPLALQTTVERALAVNPSERFPTAAALEAALNDASVRSPREAPFWSRLQVRRALSAVALLVALVGGVIWRVEQRPSRNAASSATPFQERDWLLIVPFENRTGEAVFDGVTELALERELTNSPFVNVVPRERIENALQLLNKPIDSTVDERLARDIASRDGGIRVLLAGSIDKSGPEYVITARAVDTSGETQWTRRAATPAASEVLAAVGRLAFGIRESLGETASSLQTFPAGGTLGPNSLTAFRSYADGVKHSGNRQWRSAAEAFSNAVEHDPTFGLAHLMLAQALRAEALDRPGHISRSLRALRALRRTAQRTRSNAISFWRPTVICSAKYRDRAARATRNTPVCWPFGKR